MTITELKERFEQVVSTYIKRDGIQDLMNYLQVSGFYESPASTKYHGSFVGGLCQHSLNVFYALQDQLTFIFGQGWEQRYSEESVAIVSLFHDLCKVGKYQKGVKNVKDKNTGVWETVECFEWNPDCFQMGHAAASLYTIQKFIKLTDEEAQAIYWHMGAYDLSQYSTVSGLSESFSRNTLAFSLHMADMMATYVDENEHFKPLPLL
jgi:hypothetical protein